MSASLDAETRRALFDEAAAIVAGNDRGDYTVPTRGLYPFQWNWDSCLVALGQRHVDEARAWREIGTLLDHRWEDGMVPHIVFHEPDEGYFPGPEVWGTNRPVPTSGITQPPVAGFAVRRLFDGARAPRLAAERARALLEPIDRWHAWFHRCRDPAGTGLVALIHPWESGRDNSIDWDAAFERVPSDGVAPYRRRDTAHADPAHRPTRAQYDRYVWLLERFRFLGWDNAKLHDASPFRIVDPGFNAILIRSCADLADLADALGEPGIARANRERATRGLAALESLWSDAHGQYLCFDRAAGEPVDSASVGGPAARTRADPRREARRARAQAPRARRAHRLPRAEPRPGRPALRREALLARTVLADRELPDRRRAPRGRRAGGGRAHRALEPGADRARRLRRVLRPAHRAAVRRRLVHVDGGDGHGDRGRRRRDRRLAVTGTGPVVITRTSVHRANPRPDRGTSAIRTAW